MNPKEKRAALMSVFTEKLQNGNLIVLDELTFSGIKTKNMVTVLKNINADKAYVVIVGKDQNVVLSCRNIPNMKLSSTGTLSIYDILKYNKLVLTKEAVKAIEEVYA
jgi:large subunit ribosomal protein L4